MSQTQESGRSLRPTNGHLAQLASDVLAMAKKHGATEADVVVADGENLSVQIRLGSVDRLSKAREKRLGLRIFVGKRSATSSTSDFSSESLRRLVSETCTLAKAVVEDPVSGLPGADQLATEQPDLDLHDETRLDTDRQIDLAKRAEAAALASDEPHHQLRRSRFRFFLGACRAGEQPRIYRRLPQFQLFAGRVADRRRSGLRQHATRCMVRRAAKISEARRAGGHRP